MVQLTTGDDFSFRLTLVKFSSVNPQISLHNRSLVSVADGSVQRGSVVRGIPSHMAHGSSPTMPQSFLCVAFRRWCVFNCVYFRFAVTRHLLASNALALTKTAPPSPLSPLLMHSHSPTACAHCLLLAQVVVMIYMHSAYARCSSKRSWAHSTAWYSLISLRKWTGSNQIFMFDMLLRRVVLEKANLKLGLQSI